MASEKSRNLLGFIGWAGGVVVVWAASGYLLYGYEGRGTFGDMFGAVNALFSGLAFAGVIYAIVLQRDELELQRRELEQTRKELEGQKEALNSQNEAFARQTFESSFFQLLALQSQIVHAIDLSFGPNKRFQGRDCFEKFVQHFNSAYCSAELISLPTSERIAKAYAAFYKIHQKDVAHYFRSLYHLIRFVHLSDVPAEEKRRYTSLVRASLSSNELVLLFFNCLTDLGSGKFKPLIERYGLLKNLDDLPPLLTPELRSLYGPGAFGAGVREDVRE